MNVAAAISAILSLRSTNARMLRGGMDRRRAFDDVGDLAREVPVMSLNQGQDFDGPLLSLIDAVAPELDWNSPKPYRLFVVAEYRGRCHLVLQRRYAKRHAPTKF